MFNLTSLVHLPSYLLVMSLSFTVSVIYFYKRAIKLNLPAKVSTEISLMIMVGAFIGARVFHIIFEYPTYYWEHPFEVFKFYKGGFVFYGGLIGGLITSYIYVKKIKQNYANWLDCFALVLPVGYMIGRFGCFLAGCCYGKQCSLPWAITFGQNVEAPAGIPLHPTQFYAIMFEFLIWCCLYTFEKRRSQIAALQPSGSLFYFWMILHGWARLLIEPLRGDFRGDIIHGLSISFFLSLVMIGAGFFGLYRNISRLKSQN